MWRSRATFPGDSMDFADAMRKFGGPLCYALAKSPNDIQKCEPKSCGEYDLWYNDTFSLNYEKPKLFASKYLSQTPIYNGKGRKVVLSVGKLLYIY